MCEQSGVKPLCAMKVNAVFVAAEVGLPCEKRGRTIDRSRSIGERFEYEHICWDPKDGELCLSRAKPGETLVEARSDSDVQIDRQIWV